MATINDVAGIARNYLRDFPRFFQATFPVVGRTYQLGHPNIDTNSLYVARYVPGSGSASVIASVDYALDERNGILRLATTPPANNSIMVEGYYYEWLTPNDLQFFAKMSVNKHISTLHVPLEALSDVVIDVIGMATVVEALWSLLTEFSRDIDVITSESVHIPASQRFRMVQSLLGQWEEEYRKAAKALNIGLERMEIFTLRRVSRTTNRLVPLYRSKELGDYGPMEQLFPPIDDGVLEIEQRDDDLRTDVYVDGMPRSGGLSSNAFF
jgi:hypothetical protein